MKTLLRALALFAAVAAAHAQPPAQEFLSRELPWGQGVRLADFGGPDLEIFVKAREMTHVAAEVVDYTRLVPIARANAQGFIADTKMVPTRTAVRVEKQRGIPAPGGRHEMYLLYHEAETGLSVYFVDSIARQNHDNVIIAIPKQAPPLEKEVLSNANTASPLIPELAEWYRRLLDERRTLDTTDAVAVERFNQHAADYHAALQKTRAAREALKLAPGQGTR